MLVGICNPGIHIPTPARILLKTRDESMLFSVCDLLIKILLATQCQPCQTSLLDRETNKNRHENKKHEDIHRTQHTDYNSTSIQQSMNALRAKRNNSFRDT